jgi:hypothetical protein
MMNHDRRNRFRVSPSAFGLVLGASVALLTSWGIARAETPDIGIDPSQAQPIFDNQLDTMRGKFLPGQVEAFSLSLDSTIQGNGVSRTAGVDIGVNFKTGRPIITNDETFNSETATGGPTVPGGTATGGSVPLTNLTGGVGQVVQIVGSGNSALNSATIDISSNPLSVQTPPSTGGTPCTTCSVTQGKNGIDVSVDAPGVGDADQMIGAQQITQGISLNANDAAAINSLSLQVQMQPGPGSNLVGLGSIVNSVPGLLH